MTNRLDELVNQYVPRTKAPRKEIFAWAMYDFANSCFCTIIGAAIFSAYFVDVIASGVESGLATLWLTIVLSISSLVVVITAPVLGSIADLFACKKKFLLVCAIGCVACVAALALAGRGDITFALGILLIANIFYGTGENLIAAFLPELTSPTKMGRVSAFGWMLGYVGGLIIMLICLLYALHAESTGTPRTHYVPDIMLITAGCFALAATVTFAGLKERAQKQEESSDGNVLMLGARRLKETLVHASYYADLFNFLKALLIFGCGITTVVSVAAVYAQEVMGFKPSDTVLLIAAVNITGALGSLIFGFIQDRVGSVKTLSVTLMLWSVAGVIAAVSSDRIFFWLAAGIIGIAMGASQSVSRAFVGRLSPPDRSAEFFGLWGLALKLAAAIGPLCFGVVTFITGNNFRMAMLVTILFFVLGFLLLQSVNEERGCQRAGKKLSI
jgi:MFS transporter, UMF1 family